MDIITYVPDVGFLNTELSEACVDDECELHDIIKETEQGGYQLNISKIPTFKSGTESLSLVYNGECLVENLDSMERLGICKNGEYIFDSEECQNTYERVRGDLNGSCTEEDGTVTTYTKPYMIGVFAR